MGMLKRQSLHLKKLYRNSKLGEALVLSLDFMVERGRIPGNLAIDILELFDISIYERLQHQKNMIVKLQGHVKTYNSIQNVWQYFVKDTRITIETQREEVGPEKYE